jgi:hypothetical protein
MMQENGAGKVIVKLVDMGLLRSYSAGLYTLTFQAKESINHALMTDTALQAYYDDLVRKGTEKQMARLLVLIKQTHGDADEVAAAIMSLVGHDLFKAYSIGLFTLTLPAQVIVNETLATSKALRMYHDGLVRDGIDKQVARLAMMVQGCAVTLAAVQA